jgi:predicted aspartyl protease
MQPGQVKEVPMTSRWFSGATYNGYDTPCQRLQTGPGLAGVLLVLCTGMLVTGCTAYLKGVSGPVAWQATDLRVVERSVAGTERDIYAFTLVLEETQGTAITFTHLESTVSQPGVNTAGVTRQSSILWKLRPRGELRHPFSFYWYCADINCQSQSSPAPWYNLVLTGTNDRGQPVRVTIDARLPPNPPKPRIGRPKETPAAPTPDLASAAVGDADLVSFQTIGNKIFVHAVLNQKGYVTLLLDTGATHTFLTPDTAKRFGISPTSDALKRTTTVVGGRQVEFPLVQLSTVAVGTAVVENLEAGILASFPDAPLVDGILGGSFLKHFTLTLDHATSRLRLTPKDPPLAAPSSTVSAAVAGRSAVPIRIVHHLVLVRAVLNHKEPVTLLIDTGATHTILTPNTVQRLGLSPMADTPRRTLRVADGQLHEVPLVQLAALTVGEATVENLQVGVSVLFPRAPAVDGLLGGDFLEQFRMTLDRTTRQMWLEPHQVVQSQ